MWITELIDTYKQGFPELNKPGQAKWLSDDYVKFIRFAQWRIERTGQGIVGYHPAEKWLKDRKNRVLAYDDITHYRRICSALAETREIMQRIDHAIESHGGWPRQ